MTDTQHRTYLVSAPIVSYFYTQLIGDAKHMPSLVASPNFQGIAVIGMRLSISRANVPPHTSSSLLNRRGSGLVRQPEQLVSTSGGRVSFDTSCYAQLPLYSELPYRCLADAHWRLGDWNPLASLAGDFPHQHRLPDVHCGRQCPPRFVVLSRLCDSSGTDPLRLDRYLDGERKVC